MKVIIIGANGFLGSHIVRLCLDKNWQVFATYNNNQDNIPSQANKIHIAGIKKLKDDFNIVFTTAGNFTQDHSGLMSSNVILTNQLTKLFKSAKLVFVSSISVYGIHQDIIDENSSFSNPTTYGLSKIAGEFITLGHANFSIVRFTNLYGSGMITKSFIPTIIKDAIKNRAIILKNKIRMHDYLAVEDAASFCIKAGSTDKNGIYLGATGKSVSNLEIAKILQKLIPNTKIEFIESDNSPSYFFNPKISMKELNWEAERSIKKDLKSLVKFYESSNI